MKGILPENGSCNVVASPSYHLVPFRWILNAPPLEVLLWFLLYWNSWNMLLFRIKVPNCTADIMQNESVIGCQVASPSRKQSSGIIAIITLDAGAFNILCAHFKPHPGLCLNSNHPLLPIVMHTPPKQISICFYVQLADFWFYYFFLTHCENRVLLRLWRG